MLTRALQRAQTVIKNLPYLPHVLSPLEQGAPWSECNPGNYESAQQFTHAMVATMLPIFAPFREVPHLPYEVPAAGAAIDDGQAWFFLNGICTDRNVLRLNGKALADRFQRRIHLMHNPSDGMFLDLLECMVGRTMQPISTLESSVASILKEALEKHKKVVLIAHSQGGIITTGALKKLVQELIGSRARLLNKLEVYTFASAATEMDLPQIYAEHFYHSDDFVARIGIADNPEAFSGRKFYYKAAGHLLNAHYLPSFAAGKFVSADGQPSRLLAHLPTSTKARPATSRH